MNHFQGIVPQERWMNDVLSELRQIRELLERDSKTVEQEPAPHKEPVKMQVHAKRPYNKRGAKQ